jgi:hypothetical protein
LEFQEENGKERLPMNSMTNRRLAQLVTALVPVPIVMGVHDGAPRLRAGTANGLGVLVEQDPETGIVSEAALLPVVEAKMAAVVVEDYALAGHLNQIIKVLHPANRLTPVSQRNTAPRAPTSRCLTRGGAASPPHSRGRTPQAMCKPDPGPAQVEFFHEHGFVIIPGVLEGEHLARAQAAWQKTMEPQYAVWEAEREKGSGGFRHTEGGGFAEGTTVSR